MPDDGLGGAGVASMMRAVRLHSPRGAEGLVLEEIETPSLEAARSAREGSCCLDHARRARVADGSASCDSLV